VTDRTASPRNIVVASLLCKTYEAFERKIEVLRDVDMTVGQGGFSVVSGPSGSGKTTLLNMIGGIDKPTSGKVLVFDEDLSNKDEDLLAVFRCAKVGHVFQSYNLISTLTVTENVAFPMEWLRKPGDEIRERVRTLLEMVGLSDRAEHFPYQLSGGEQQRVAFARALANDPPLLLADEPTGNLDEKTSAQIVQILQTLKEGKKTVVVATHDSKIIELGDQSLWLENGKLMRRDE
jgi:putative ABC transport system ATP-binding protein